MTELRDRLVSHPHNVRWTKTWAEEWILGWIEGWFEGRAEAKQYTARTMLADGMSKELIMKYTGLSLQQIEEIER